MRRLSGPVAVLLALGVLGALYTAFAAPRSAAQNTPAGAQSLAGTTAGNTAVNVATGTNAISAGAFSNMSGLPIVIQNSGANVLIQNAVILNLQMN